MHCFHLSDRSIALANLGSTLQNTFASGSRVLDILEEEPLVEEIKDEKEVSFNGAKAENVTFAYKDEIILDNLSADIPKKFSCWDRGQKR